MVLEQMCWGGGDQTETCNKVDYNYIYNVETEAKIKQLASLNKNQCNDSRFIQLMHKSKHNLELVDNYVAPLILNLL